MPRELTRKEKRQAERKMVKIRRASYNSKRDVTAIISQTEADKPKMRTKLAHKNRKRRQAAKDVKLPHASKSESAKAAAVKKALIAERAAAKERMQAHRDGMKADDAEIRKMTKNLGYKKRKSKALPAVFASEGLDYLLNFCDAEDRRALVEEDDAQVEDDDADDVDNDSEQEDGEQDDSDDSDVPMEEASSNQLRSATAVAPADDTSDGEQVADEEEVVADNVEDIYGRSKSLLGITSSAEGAKSKLAALESRMAVDSGGSSDAVLVKKCRAIINRLSTRTMHASIESAVAMYSTDGRKHVRDVITSAVVNIVCQPQPLSTVLCLDLALFTTLLHSATNANLSAHLVETLACRYRTLHAAMSDGDASVNNIVLFMCRLWQLKMTSSRIILDLLEHPLETASQTDAVIVRNILTHVGLSMRKAEPTKLNAFLERAAARVAGESSGAMASLQLALECVRTNSSSFMPDREETDKKTVEEYVKLRRTLLKGKTTESPLGMGLSDLWDAESRGRWWVVGSAFSHMPTAAKNEGAESMTGLDRGLVATARAMGMKTDVRVRIFCAICTASNATDAVNLLMRLNLKSEAERELVHVCVLCCLRESEFNVYYAQVVRQLIDKHKRFKVTTQYALWDRIRDLSSMETSACTRLAELTVHLLLSDGITLTVLRVLPMAQLGAHTAEYLRRVLLGVLRQCDENALTHLMGCMGGKHRELTDGLHLFAQRSLDKAIAKDEKKVVLRDRLAFFMQLCAKERLA